MDYPSQLSRFLQHRVTLDLYGSSTVWGKLVYVAHDHIRLLDTVIVGDLEGHGWYEQSQYAEEDGGGVRNPETIVRINSIVHVTCLEDPNSQALPSLKASTEEPCAIESEREDASDGIILSLRDLADGLRKGRDSSALQQDSADCDAITVSLSQDDYIRTADDRLMIEIGARLIPLAAQDHDGGLVQRVAKLRKELAARYGVVLPKVRIRDSFQLEESGYRIFIDGDEVARGELMVDRSLAIYSGPPCSVLDGIETVEPAFGLSALWIAKSDEGRAAAAGCTVCSPSTVLITHLSEALRSRLHELVCHQDVMDRVAELRECHPDAIDALIPGRVSITVLHRLLQNLLEENVRIKRLMRIIESVAYHIEFAKGEDQLLQRVRRDIGRTLCNRFIDSEGQLSGLSFGETGESELAALPLDPLAWAQLPILRSVASQLGSQPEKRLVVVRNPGIRRLLFDAFARLSADVNVIAREEIPRDVRLSLVEIEEVDRSDVAHTVMPR